MPGIGFNVGELYVFTVLPDCLGMIWQNLSNVGLLCLHSAVDEPSGLKTMQSVKSLPLFLGFIKEDI